jgi:hypothetical protein
MHYQQFCQDLFSSLSCWLALMVWAFKFLNCFTNSISSRTSPSLVIILAIVSCVKSPYLCLPRCTPSTSPNFFHVLRSMTCCRHGYVRVNTLTGTVTTLLPSVFSCYYLLMVSLPSTIDIFIIIGTVTAKSTLFRETYKLSLTIWLF